MIQSEVWGQGFPHPLFVGKFYIIEQRILKDGHIIEQGNHESLLAKNGFYAKLYNSQFAL